MKFLVDPSGRALIYCFVCAGAASVTNKKPKQAITFWQGTPLCEDHTNHFIKSGHI